MSPITHGMIGWLVAWPLKERKDRVLVTSAALIADIDGLGVLISKDLYGLHHHTFGHNIIFGIFFTLICLAFCNQKKLASILIFLSYISHLIGDLLGSGSGWGIPFLWPVKMDIVEFSPPFQWELDSWQNALVTLICLALTIICSLKNKRTFVEVISLKIDQIVVKTINHWFKKAA